MLGQLHTRWSLSSLTVALVADVEWSWPCMDPVMLRTGSLGPGGGCAGEEA